MLGSKFQPTTSVVGSRQLTFFTNRFIGFSAKTVKTVEFGALRRRTTTEVVG